MAREAFPVSDVRLYSNTMRGRASLDRQNFGVRHDVSIYILVVFGRGKLIWARIIFVRFFMEY